MMQKQSFLLLVPPLHPPAIYSLKKPVLRTRLRIRIRTILCLLDPDLDTLVGGMEPDPAPDPSITKQK
jgi:hypothetical protein